MNQPNEIEYLSNHMKDFQMGPTSKFHFLMLVSLSLPTSISLFIIIFLLFGLSIPLASTRTFLPFYFRFFLSPAPILSLPVPYFL